MLDNNSLARNADAQHAAYMNYLYGVFGEYPPAVVHGEVVQPPDVSWIEFERRVKDPIGLLINVVGAICAVTLPLLLIVLSVWGSAAFGP